MDVIRPVFLAWLPAGSFLGGHNALRCPRTPQRGVPTKNRHIETKDGRFPNRPGGLPPSQKYAGQKKPPPWTQRPNRKICRPIKQKETKFCCIPELASEPLRESSFSWLSSVKESQD